jgi:hypothetical protein
MRSRKSKPKGKGQMSKGKSEKRGVVRISALLRASKYDERSYVY